MDLVEIKPPTRKLSKFFLDQKSWEHFYTSGASSSPEAKSGSKSVSNKEASPPLKTNSTVESAQAVSSNLLKQIQMAEDSLHQFRAMDWNETLLEPYKTHMNFYELFLDWIHFDRWPQGVRWGLESLSIIAVVVVISVFLPWHKISGWKNWISSDQVVLNETNRTKTLFKEDAEGEDVSSVNGAEGVSVLYPDEPERKGVPAPVAESLPSSVAKASNPSSSTVAGVSGQNPQSKSTPSKSPTDPPAGIGNRDTEAESESTATSANSASKRSGFLYRAQFKVTNLEVVTAKSIEAIGELGGRKAGQVPLGWRKGSGSYFHFTIPESKISALKEFLGQFGDLQLEKEKHERAMPEGIARIIIQMEEK